MLLTYNNKSDELEKCRGIGSSKENIARMKGVTFTENPKRSLKNMKVQTPFKGFYVKTLDFLGYKMASVQNIIFIQNQLKPFIQIQTVI